MYITYHAEYAAYVIRHEDGRQAFAGGFPLVFESRQDAAERLAAL